MFNRTKRKILMTVVCSLMALLTVTLTTIYLSNRIVMRRENEMMLKSYTERYNPDAPQENVSDDKQGFFDPEVHGDFLHFIRLRFQNREKS